VLGRIGCGCEISPAYCDVILRRMMTEAARVYEILAGEIRKALNEFADANG
jgi:hypothetical protein